MELKLRHSGESEIPRKFGNVVVVEKDEEDKMDAPCEQRRSIFLRRMKKDRNILHTERVRLSGLVISCLETACKKTLLKERDVYKD